MKTFTFLASLLAILLGMSTAQAQTKPTKPAPAKPAATVARPAAKPAEGPKPAAPAVASPPAASTQVAMATAPALITDKMETAAPNTAALKVRAETNPLTKRLTVRTDAAGPTRVELNSTDGRPVITRDLMNGTDAVVLDVSSLPTGTYIVQCTSGERRGIKRISVGQ